MTNEDSERMMTLFAGVMLGAGQAIGLYDPMHPEAEPLRLRVEEPSASGDFIWDRCYRLRTPDKYDSIGNRYSMARAIVEWFNANDEEAAR